MLPYVGEFILPFFAPAFMERNLDKQSDGQQNCELVEYQKKVLRAEIAACEGYLESILSTFRSFNLFSMEPIYRRVATHSRPVHIIWGDLDSTCPFEQSKTLRSIMPHSEFTVVEGGAHTLLGRFFEPTVTAMETFLKAQKLP
mmetsp:Transcript_28282/g.72142  ORF Transcript_28282/g.72142 Transcript_28282/m.72142 type:complete len:143 (+) Transcript_28282:1191-1619(+)